MSIKKVLVGTDLEGVAGVVGFADQAWGAGKYYEQARLLLTGEINAAVEGLLEEGVEDILVTDGHGSGGVHYESLHPAAKLMHGRPLAARTVRDQIISAYDVGIMIGQHAMCGVPDGNLNHTQESRRIEYYKLNGREIGETAQWSLYHGAMGIPVIFLSGDEAACREARELIPGIAAASVKIGLSRESAISLSIRHSRDLIRQNVRSAIRKQRETPIPPLSWPGPYILEKRYLFTNSVDCYEGHKFLHKIVDSKTVQLKSDDIKDIIYA